MAVVLSSVSLGDRLTSSQRKFSWPFNRFGVPTMASTCRCCVEDTSKLWHCCKSVKPFRELFETCMLTRINAGNCNRH
jgi:hypothetical protein